MAIGSSQPGFTFDPHGIVKDAPRGSGVYALYTTQRWIYVGESDEIQRRLLEHFNEAGTCIKQQGATGFQFELVAGEQRVARQSQLIASLTPACNQKLG